MRILLLTILLVLGATAAASAAPRLSGYTNMFYGAGHGTQVEYLSPDGRTWLWYPGNKVLVPGLWKTAGGSKKNPANICFRYPSNSYNPVTKDWGGDWECQPLRIYASGMTEQARGDVFGMAKRKSVPFVLSRKRTTIARLAGHKVASVKPNGSSRAPAEIYSGDVTKLTCRQMKAAADGGKLDTMSAALFYAHGMWMGDRCARPDYVKSFTLLRQYGGRPALSNMQSILKDIVRRANSGSPGAQRALRKLKSAGFIELATTSGKTTARVALW